VKVRGKIDLMRAQANGYFRRELRAAYRFFAESNPEALVHQVLEVLRGQLHHFRRCCRLVGKQEAVFPRFLLRIVSLRDRFGVPIEYEQFDLTSGRIPLFGVLARNCLAVGNHQSRQHAD
jgi:hypothetical protein